MLLNSLNFCLSVKLLISSSSMNEILAGYSNLVCRFFSFQHFKYILPFSSGLQRFCGKIAVILVGIPLYVTCCFSLAAFNVFSLCLSFVSLIKGCLGIFLLMFILYGTLWVSWTWVALSFPHFREIFNYCPLKYFLTFFPIVFFWECLWFKYWGVQHCSKGLWGCSHFFLFFSFSTLLHLFPLFYFPAHFSFLLPQLLLVPSRVFLILVIAFFITDWLFFISSKSLLSIS